MLAEACWTPIGRQRIPPASARRTPSSPGEPVLESGVPMSKREPAVTKEQSDRILKRMM